MCLLISDFRVSNLIEDVFHSISNAIFQAKSQNKSFCPTREAPERFHRKNALLSKLDR